jgi:tetratricopeptide (TPR) repeat protein
MKSKIILFGILALFMTSCGEKFLDIQSQTSLTSDSYFKTEADFTQAINGAYAPLRILYDNAFVLGEMHSDNARYILNTSYRATIANENAADFIYEASNGVSTTKYQTAYLVIARANQVLATIDGVSITDASKSNIKGQALFLRAFAYLDLVQYFGSIPLHLTPASSIEETALPLATADAVYQQIIADAKQAADLLPEKSTQEAGRATKGAAKMLLSNVYMIQKNYAGAETLLKEIVNSNSYSLMADYASIYSPANKNNAESIFEIQYKQGTDGYSSSFIYKMLPYPLAKDTLAKLTQVSNPNALTEGEGYNTPTPDLIGIYDSGDLRKNASIGYVHDMNGTLFPYVKKYLHPHLLYQNSDDNWPVYRYAEVLLYLAEAINEQNRPAEALTYLNNVIGKSAVSIRGRAGLTSIAASSQSDVRTAIAKERRIELAFENKRWLDLVRTGKAVEVMTAYGAKVKANPQSYYFPKGYIPVASAYTQISLVWPLPASESLLSPYF